MTWVTRDWRLNRPEMPRVCKALTSTNALWRGPEEGSPNASERRV